MRGFVSLGVLALSCAAPAVAQTAAPMSPGQAIAAARASKTGEAAGVFEMQVGSIGESGFSLFLNSAKDYRDPANLSADLQPGAIAELKGRLGGEPRDLLAGKRVRIKGTARRVPIPKRDGSTYYQTRIDVDRGDQIEILG